MPTYWVAVISSEHVKSSTVVKRLCNRNTIESVVISCHFKYCPRFPSNLYMIPSFYRVLASPSLIVYKFVRLPSRDSSHVAELFTSKGETNKLQKKKKRIRERNTHGEKIVSTETSANPHQPRSGLKSGKMKRNRHTDRRTACVHAACLSLSLFS